MADLASLFQSRAGFLTALDLTSHLAECLGEPEACPGQHALTDRWLARRFAHDSASILVGLLRARTACDCEVVKVLGVPVAQRLARQGIVIPDASLGLAVVTWQQLLGDGGWYQGDRP